MAACPTVLYRNARYYVIARTIPHVCVYRCGSKTDEPSAGSSRSSSNSSKIRRRDPRNHQGARLIIHLRERVLQSLPRPRPPPRYPPLLPCKYITYLNERTFLFDVYTFRNASTILLSLSQERAREDLILIISLIGILIATYRCTLHYRDVHRDRCVSSSVRSVWNANCAMRSNRLHEQIYVCTHICTIIAFICSGAEVPAAQRQVPRRF